MKTRNELSAREVDDLHDTLLRRLGDSSVPTLPHVAARVLELVGNRNATFKDFANVIQTDQALSGRLLRMANSAFFAQREPVTRIDRAAILLGLDRLRALSLGFHLSKAAVCAEGAAAHRRLWTYSLFRAWLACRLAERVDRTLTGEAFIIGLMCDAGAPLMPSLVGDLYTQITDDNALPHEQHALEFRSLPFTHVDVAAAMCRLWKLPDMLRKPIVMHHDAARPPSGKDALGVLHAVAYFVAGIPLSAMDRRDAPAASRDLGRHLFNLDAQSVRGLVEAAGRDLDASRDVFHHIMDDTVSVEAIIESANAHIAESMDDAIPDELREDAGETRRIRTTGGCLEAMRTAPNRVRVYINDAKGARILSEEIRIDGRSDADIAGVLMLGELPADEADRVIAAIRNIAA